MKPIFSLFLGVLLAACSHEKVSTKIRANYQLQTAKLITLNKDIVYFNQAKFNGFLLSLAVNNLDTLSIEGYSQGLLNGVSKKWYTNKQLMELRYYKNGKKDGEQLSFWKNGNQRFKYTAKNDAYEGQMTEWTVDGKLFHVGNYVNGQEEGTQKMWYENGKTRANYVIRNGKRYGLLGTKNCKNVSDSIFLVK
jgi:antitoxin component YwqK of YwqJK toxin-antitoxin module